MVTKPASDSSAPANTIKSSGKWIGLALFAVMLAIPTPEGFTPVGWRTAAVGSLMAIWWVTETLHISATALLPLICFPALNILPIREAASPYANPIIFLFLGGFVMAKAIEHCGLHKRFALLLMSFVGRNASHVVAGFMGVTAFISMWVSNTATIVMIYPMVLSIIDLNEKDSDGHLAVALLLGIAYAANIGGIATLIGTPPNALLAGFMLETYNIRIGFSQWMLLGLPLVLLALPLTWFLLTKVKYPLGKDAIKGSKQFFEEYRISLGAMSSREYWVAGVVIFTALGWILRPQLVKVLPGLSDASIAITGALLMFFGPTSKLEGQVERFDWRQAERLPWSVLVLFGGGLSLASAVQKTELAQTIGTSLTGLGALPFFATALILTCVVLFLTELTSNTATTAAFLPIAGSIAVGIGAPPYMLAIPVALAASCAFMMPVATPPNAVVFGTGRITISQMAKTGIWLNLIMLLIINVLVLSFGTYFFAN